MDNLEYLKLARDLTGSTNIMTLIEAARQISQYHMEAPGAAVVEDKVSWINIRSIADFVNQQHTYHPLKGFIPFKPFPFQKKLIVDMMSDHKITLINNARQMGMTACMSMVALYEAVTQPNKTILIVAPKLQGAIEFLDRIRNYIQTSKLDLPVVETNNKCDISFNNGSRIITRAVSGDSGRGLTLDLIMVCEAAFISYSKEQEFWQGIQPCLNEHDGRIIIQSTPKYDEGLFYKLWTNNNIPAERLVLPWNEHPDRDAAWEATTRSHMGVSFMNEYECQFISKPTI